MLDNWADGAATETGRSVWNAGHRAPGGELRRGAVAGDADSVDAELRDSTQEQSAARFVGGTAAPAQRKIVRPTEEW